MSDRRVEPVVRYGRMQLLSALGIGVLFMTEALRDVLRNDGGPTGRDIGTASLFGGMLLVLLTQLIRPGTALRIGPDGVKVGGRFGAFVPWDAIGAVAVVNVSVRPAAMRRGIVVVPADPEVGVWRRLRLRLSTRLHGFPIVVYERSLDVELEDVVELLHRYQPDLLVEVVAGPLRSGWRIGARMVQRRLGTYSAAAGIAASLSFAGYLVTALTMDLLYDHSVAFDIAPPGTPTAAVLAALALWALFSCAVLYLVIGWMTSTAVAQARGLRPEPLRELLTGARAAWKSWSWSFPTLVGGVVTVPALAGFLVVPRIILWPVAVVAGVPRPRQSARQFRHDGEVWHDTDGLAVECLLAVGAAGLIGLMYLVELWSAGAAGIGITIAMLCLLGIAAGLILAVGLAGCAEAWTLASETTQ